MKGIFDALMTLSAEYRVVRRKSLLNDEIQILFFVCNGVCRAGGEDSDSGKVIVFLHNVMKIGVIAAANIG